MVFCPRCGASLKGAPTPGPVPPTPPYQKRDEKAEKNEEKQEKNQNPEKGEKNEKGERGFIGYLIGGLILITIGLFSILSISGIWSGESWAIMVLLIGVIIIIGAVYVALVARRHNPHTGL